MIGKLDFLLLIACMLVSTGLFLSGPPGEKRDPEASVRSVAKSSQAAVEGTVILPPSQPNRRRFRGRAYRQRTSRGRSQGEDAPMPNEENRYRTVVVSAHPLSFDPSIEPLREPAEIDQRDATFVPQVTPVTAGSAVEFINSDPFYHNVFSLTPGARFNIGRRPTDVVVPETIPALDDPVPGLGVVELHCDIHPQMNAFVVSLQTPYYTRVSEDGTYRLDDLPAGRYEIRAYMPRQDLARFEVELSEDDVLTRTIDLR
jgi:plastocyanin